MGLIWYVRLLSMVRRLRNEVNECVDGDGWETDSYW